MSNTYSFRAEAQVDVSEFMEKLIERKIGLSRYVIVCDINSPSFTDVWLEFDTNADLPDLLNVASEVVDGHIMWRTLRQCSAADNDGSYERA